MATINQDGPLYSPAELGLTEELAALQAARQARGQNNFVIGTRASKLAMIQAHLVQDALKSRYPALDINIAPMSVAGDRDKTSALYLIGGKAKALWTEDLEVALIEGGIDCIIHSLKDVPTTIPETCRIGAIMEREDERDCLVVKAGLPYTRLEDLPDGSVIGTSSVRRVAQLRRCFPRLTYVDVRGNLDTRLNKLDGEDGPYSAIILASAGLIRFGMAHRITCPLSSPQLLPAVGQGALGIEIRSNDPIILRLIAPLDHWQSSWRCRAERELLRCLEGGCSVPVGCETEIREISPPTVNGHGYTNYHTNGASTPHAAQLTIHGIIVSLSGAKAVERKSSRIIHSPEEAEALGHEVALALIKAGGREILEELGKRRSDATFAERHQQAVELALARSTRGISPGASDQPCG